jgi:aspartate carbamoyltransferase
MTTNSSLVSIANLSREKILYLIEYERVKDVYILRRETLAKARPNLRILHPLPHVNEIAQDVTTRHTHYFEQARNGLFARETIICDVLGITLDEVRADGAALSQNSAL